MFRNIHVPTKRRHQQPATAAASRRHDWTGCTASPHLSWASHSAGMWKPSSRGFERQVLLLAAAARTAAFEFVVEFIVEFIVRRMRADASRNPRANAVV